MRNFFVILITSTIVVLSVWLLQSGKSATNNTNTKVTISFPDHPTPLQEKPPEVSLIAVGDVMLSRTVAEKMRIKGDFYPFLKVSDFLKSADIVFGNLESPITSGRIIKSGEMEFRADPEVAQNLVQAGFTILSLANNHIPNFGNKGITDTVNILDQYGIKHTGAGTDAITANKPATLTIKGIVFAFLAYNDSDVVPAYYEAKDNSSGTAFMLVNQMATAIESAKKLADYVIVSMHSGNEYAHSPNQSQISFARAAIESGADLVIGHHPHVIQPVEVYEGKYIFYSLGNFIFDQMWSTDTRQGSVIRIGFTKEKIVKISLYEIIIDDYSQPHFTNIENPKELYPK